MITAQTCSSPACGLTTNHRFQICPRCGTRTKPERPLRWLGWWMLGLGLLLALLAGGSAALLTPSLVHPGDQAYSPRFDGTLAQANAAINTFLALIAFGLTTLLVGIHLIKASKPHTSLILLEVAGFAVVIRFAMVLSAVMTD